MRVSAGDVNFIQQYLLKISKKGKRVYTHELMHELCARIKKGEVSFDNLAETTPKR